MTPRRLLAGLPWMLAASLAAEEIAIRPEESVLAVVTHKGGFAAGRAHDHLIAAPAREAALAFDPRAPLAASFEIDFAAADLAVDPWEAQRAAYPRLEALGILGEPFTEVAEKDRGKIRKSMLGEGQLDAARHPRVRARLAGVREEPSTHGGVAFPYVATLELEVKGVRVEKPVAARFEAGEGNLAIEAFGVFRFTDFGIEPYSAFLGAVKNLDEIHVYLSLVGSLPAAPAGTVEVSVSQR